jgi:ABC-type microcin C transport system duplicated ATPase subunit YejF
MSAVQLPLLEVTELRIPGVPAEDGLSFQLEAGGALSFVGDDPGVNTALALALLGLPDRRRIEGQIRFAGEDLLALDRAALRRLRGGSIGLCSSDPRLALDPLLSVGAQISDAVGAHAKVSKQAARDRAIDLLELVGIAQPHRRVNAAPGLLSAADQRRAQLALALAGQPRLLVADDPARGLEDADSKALLWLLEALHSRHGFALIALGTDDAPA